MNERDMAERNKILVVRTGSYLYGTNTPESDEDFVGIFMPDEEYVYGFKRVDEVDMSVHSKNEDGKNTKDAVDIKYYEFRKFVKLAMENNPNILEVLFVNKENIIFCNDLGDELLYRAKMFPHQGAKQKFLGYAFSQKHKMVVKKDNYFDLLKAKEWLAAMNDFSLWECEQFMDKSVFKRQLHNLSGKTDFYQVGDINLQPHLSVKNALKIINERLDKVGNREDLYLKHAYDTKFAMHLVRLMMEGYALLLSGELQFPFNSTRKETLMSIREGKKEIKEVVGIAEKYQQLIENMTSGLRARPMYEEIEKFVIEVMKRYLK